ncbi:MAG: Hsp20/alpha crystallin family protein, partial [Kiritimatiellae bacterium]|nr:Hsp20/alpha crystallin family protein [Kiritimatiellia bacterium]
DAQAWSPNTDVCEGPDEVVIRMEVAAVPIESLEVQLEEQSVVIRGVREDTACEESAAGYRFRQLEIEYGPFQRTVRLPYAIDGDHAKANMRNGMLEIRLPRAQAAKHTTISVIVEP